MKISAIVAMGKNRQIGLNNKLLWHNKEDLQNFKKLTLGHHILMGRKTFLSIGKPLPGRENLVLTRDVHFEAPDGVLTVHSIERALIAAQASGETELFIIGGGEIYKETMSILDRIYLSTMDYDGAADTFFPEYKHLGFRTVQSRDCGGWKFEVLER
jgi:dihydrofolate reductase